MFKNLSANLAILIILSANTSCATSIKWEGKADMHAANYMQSFDKYRKRVCTPKTQETFDKLLTNYRGQGYWIPELNDDVDVETIKSLLPEMEKKVSWIKEQKSKLKSNKLPSTEVTTKTRELLAKLLVLKKSELSSSEELKTKSRQESLKLQGQLLQSYEDLIGKISFFTNYHFPVDHLKNRKAHDQYREKEDDASVKIANYTFLYRKILEDGAYNKERSSSDIYLRTTLDTLYFELKRHDFYLTEDARYDLEFVLSKIESELSKGKNKLLERLEEWETRSIKGLSFYQSLTLPDHQNEIMIDGKKTTPNKELIREHNKATEELKSFVYKKQAEVYDYWLNQPELPRAIFVLETILLNEVGGVDGNDALERIDVARVVLNRLDKPKYLAIGKKEFLYPYLKEIIPEKTLKSERWLNALFKQGEFSFTYYYMKGGSQIFCPDMAAGAKRLRSQNVDIALRVLKEEAKDFKTTRYFSRASMIGRIHMDTVWEDYVPYPERPGLLVDGQAKLQKALDTGNYTYLYSFKDPLDQLYQVLQISGSEYAMGEKNGLKLFFQHRNPHYFRYFTKID